jgi:K+/H+ antiporter YhaU regulatory subunit KhtT
MSDISQDQEDWEQISAILESSRIRWEQVQRMLPQFAEEIQEQLENHQYGKNIARSRLRRFFDVDGTGEKST